MIRLYSICIFVITILVFTNENKAQQVNYSSNEILLQLQKLNTVGSVLYVAAHPDDENTRLLSYLAKEKKVKTAYLSLTRGDGGQNLIGTEQAELLGLIRTQELLAARRIDGAEQFFSRAYDFGYSKNPEETFLFWKKDSILSDAVWIIRNFKPDIIICRFPTTGEGGHGHHTASAIIAQEAFAAAADENRFKEQLKFTKTWKAKHIFWNTFNFGSTNTTSENQIKEDVGVYNTLLGKSYGEIAAESRTMHKSQGFGSAKNRGSSIEYFKQLDKDSVKYLFENTSLKWDRFKGTEKFQEKLNSIIENFNSNKPYLSVSKLIELVKELNSIKNTDENFIHYQKIKLKEIEQLILACSGIWAEASSSDYTVSANSNVAITAQIINRSAINVSLEKISFLDNNDTVVNKILNNNELLSIKHKELLSDKINFSNPYWLMKKPVEGLFFTTNLQLIGKPENDAALTVNFKIKIEDYPITISKGVVHKTTDPVKGEIYRPVEILPVATLNFDEKFYLFDSSNSKKIKCHIKSNQDKLIGTLQIKTTGNCKAKISNPEINLLNKGDETSIEIEIFAGDGKEIMEAYLITNEGNRCNNSITRINYDHIPAQFVLNECKVYVQKIELKKELKPIAYIEGAGDDVPKCLEQIGYTITKLSDEQILNDDLSKYAAIVTGVRAYNTNNRLQVCYKKLMNYVNNGGNLIVQYNTNNRIGPLLAKIGPYPFSISRERVTDEKSAINFLAPEHPILNYPNKISATDFENWIQERGIYFANELDSNYVSILEMNDVGENKNKGSLIAAKYGKGNFVYTGLSFFRELPAGVPGAYRLFVNLISLPQNK
ncbi:MAG: PIG-L family deacetylase [Bacteroidota bacterium]|jgi:LmbE family N-acetylglucosaminyl deacetylase